MARTKPTKLKLLEGNRGKREIPAEVEPYPAPPNLRAPIGLDPQARKTWRRLAPILSRLGLLTEADYEALAHLCQVQARLVDIRQRLQGGEDLVSDGPQGPKQNPLIMAEKQYLQNFRMYAAEFGLSPRGRSGLAVGSGDDDEDDDLLG